MKTERLRIEMPDGRKYLTNKENESKLKEFIKVFEVKLSIETENGNEPVLDLESLVQAVCETNYEK